MEYADTSLRRLPIIIALHRYIHQIEDLRRAVFVGFFGPIGVSAVFYIYISLEFLDTITTDGIQREDAKSLAEAILVVVWFLAICSIVVHGLSIPLGKLGFFLPRTLSRAFTSQGNDEPQSFHIGQSALVTTSGALRERIRNRSGQSAPAHRGASGASTPIHSNATSSRPIFRIGGTVIKDRGGVATPVDASNPSTPPPTATDRTIRFPDEPAPRTSDGERAPTTWREEREGGRNE